MCGVVPAVMALLGRRAWRMPGWLDRLVPDVDVEGAGLPVFAPAEPSTPEGPADDRAAARLRPGPARRARPRLGTQPVHCKRHLGEVVVVADGSGSADHGHLPDSP
ncbi:hypothetical protein ACFV23_07960 [Streptomyces sp. NPDC059627]